MGPCTISSTELPMGNWIGLSGSRTGTTFFSVRIEFGTMLLLYKNIFAFAFASRSRQHRGIGWNVSSCDKFLAAQFVQNQNVNTVKTRLAFLTIDRNAEILSGGFNDRFSCCWMYWLFVNFWLSGKFLNNRARESRFFFNTIYRS